MGSVQCGKLMCALSLQVSFQWSCQAYNVLALAAASAVAVQLTCLLPTSKVTCQRDRAGRIWCGTAYVLLAVCCSLCTACGMPYHGMVDVSSCCPVFGKCLPVGHRHTGQMLQ